MANVLGEHDFSTFLFPAILFVAGSVLAYTVYGAIWRLFLSPIANIPGPRVAALTFWHEAYYDILLGGKYTWKIAEYHKAYGPIVRINPLEIHINDPSFHEKLYVGSAKGKTEKWDWEIRSYRALHGSIFGTLDHDLHRIRRAPWNPYFSKQSIRSVQRHLIQRLVDKTCAKFAEYQNRGQPVTMVHAWASLTADVVSEYSFPHGYDLLGKPEFDAENYIAQMTLGRSTHLLRHFPWIYSIIEAMPLWLTKATSPIIYGSLRERERLLDQARAMRANSSTVSEKDLPSHTSLLEALTTSTLLPDVEKNPERLTSEAFIALAAGTLTTSHCLKTATYHILANPDVNKELMRQLMDGFPDPETPPTLDQLEKIPYLMAVMYESLRMFYGVAHRLSRVFPDRAMQYDSYTIPPGTPVSMSVPLIHDNEDIFPEPYSFKPERWLPLQTAGQRLMPFLVCFGGGTRVCVGMELGKAEILTALACVFRRFGSQMRLFDTIRERDVDTVYDQFGPEPSKDSNGVLVMFDKEVDA